MRNKNKSPSRPPSPVTALVTRARNHSTTLLIVFRLVRLVRFAWRLASFPDYFDRFVRYILGIDM